MDGIRPAQTTDAGGFLEWLERPVVAPKPRPQRTRSLPPYVPLPPGFKFNFGPHSSSTTLPEFNQPVIPLGQRSPHATTGFLHWLEQPVTKAKPRRSVPVSKVSSSAPATKPSATVEVTHTVHGAEMNDELATGECHVVLKWPKSRSSQRNPVTPVKSRSSSGLDLAQTNQAGHSIITGSNHLMSGSMPMVCTYEPYSYDSPLATRSSTGHEPMPGRRELYKVAPLSSIASVKSSLTSVTAHFRMPQTQNSIRGPQMADVFKAYRKDLARYRLYLVTSTREDTSSSDDSTSPETPFNKSTADACPEIAAESSSPIAITSQLIASIEDKENHDGLGFGLAPCPFTDANQHHTVVPGSAQISVPFGLESIEPCETPTTELNPMTPKEARRFEHTMAVIKAVQTRREAEKRMRLIREAGTTDPRVYDRLGNGQTMLRPKHMAEAEAARWKVRESRDQATIASGRNGAPRHRQFINYISTSTNKVTPHYTQPPVGEQWLLTRDRHALADGLNSKSTLKMGLPLIMGHYPYMPYSRDQNTQGLRA